MSVPTVTIGTGSGGIGGATITAQLIQAWSAPLSGYNTLPLPTVTNPNSILQEGSAALVSGNNTINVPAGAQGVWIVPPSPVPGVTPVALTVKGVNGDTGIPVHPSAPFPMYFPPSGAASSFVLNAGASVTVQLLWV